MMEIRLQHFFLVWIVLQWTGPAATAAADAPPGFVNLACGANASFLWNNLTYVPDNLGLGHSSRIAGVLDGTGGFLRYFPVLDDNRNLNCYSLNLSVGRNLVRATFRYGNYDFHEQPPAFQVFLKTTAVAFVDLNITDNVVEEIIIDEESNPVPFCLLPQPGRGAPVISLLEVRPLLSGSYEVRAPLVLLRTIYRIDCGGTQEVVRFPLDSYDRLWTSDQSIKPNGSVAISTNMSVDLTGVAGDSPPLSVLQTATEMVSNNNLTYSLRLTSEAKNYSVIAYFANLNSTSGNLFIIANRVSKGVLSFSQNFVATNSSFRILTSDQLIYTVVATGGAVPFLSALEVYEEISPSPQTYSKDANALNAIKLIYAQGIGDWDNWDPCLPIPWQRVSCSSEAPPRITALHLSGYLPAPALLFPIQDMSALLTLELEYNALASELTYVTKLPLLQVLNLSHNNFTAIPDFSTDVALQILDMSNNRLRGSIPGNLGELPRLSQLDVSNNDLSGIIPDSISNRQNLLFNFLGNACLGKMVCATAPAPGAPSGSNKGKSNSMVIVGVSVGAVLLVGGASCAGMVFWKRRKSSENVPERDPEDWGTAKRFSLKELNVATKHFENIRGKGGFGSVYYGQLPGGQEIAVKLRADSSRLGATSFANEVSLLSRVRHPNLVTLLGYCEEADKQGLVYEYIPNGTLADNLYGPQARIKHLDFKARLRIAIGAATGIDYLHNHCDPRIIHRDVKSSNILLDANMVARVCDFGLSRLVVNADATHVTTLVKGTAGYLDPEYYSTQQLTEKSDVYSFGIVLLEMLCAREPLASHLPPDEYSLAAWAIPQLRANSLSIVLDPSLVGFGSSLGIEMLAALIVKCVDRHPANRPNIAQVLTELRAILVVCESRTFSSGSSEPSFKELLPEGR